jgi:hypothetical protein
MLLLGLVFFGFGCGSDDGSSGISYTGITTQAVIDETNAEDIAIGALVGGQKGAELDVFGAVQTNEASAINCFPMLKVSQILEESLRRIDLTSISDGTFVGATETGTIDGTCGGSASITITYNESTFVFSGSMGFNNFCVDGITFSGNVSISGQFVDSSFEDFLTFSISYNNVTVTSGSDSLTISGTVSSDFTAPPVISFTMDFLMQDNSTGKVYWINDYTMTVTEGISYVSVVVSGEFYYPDYGYVVVSTPVPLVIYDDADWPSSGVLIATGENNTKARLTAFVDTYTIDVDADGDDSYETSLGPFYWADL